MGLQNLRGSYDERNPNRGAGWSIWTGSVPGGETIEQVGHRTERVIKQALAAGGDVLPFAHSHILRVLTACWLDLPPDAGRLFALNTASMSVLGYEHEDRVISVWNQD
jgi:broad specificity phosphatase PhoE